MEVHFTAETEEKLRDIALQIGCGTPDKLVQDVVEEYFEELSQTRELLNSRYADLKSGRVKPIPGNEVFTRLRAKSAARRAQHQ